MSESSQAIKTFTAILLKHPRATAAGDNEVARRAEPQGLNNPVNGKGWVTQ